MTMDSLAEAADVGKQTIYRWWPSKAAVLVEALTERALAVVPTPDAGSLRADLAAFLTDSFQSANVASVANSLRAVMADAQRDPDTADVLRQFTAQRRQALRALFERGRRRREVSGTADLDFLVDLAFGLLWYRMLVRNAPLDRRVALQMATALADQAGSRRPQPATIPGGAREERQDARSGTIVSRYISRRLRRSPATSASS